MTVHDDREPVLRIERLAFRRGRKPILRDVSLDVYPGENLALIGPNGAGKTTLLKCLNRILADFHGTITLMGRSLRSYSQREIARRIAYVPQAEGQVIPYTVEQFVLMGRYAHLSPFAPVGREDRRLVGEILQRTGMEAFADRRVDTLSGGERQKIYVAAALAQEASILLLDEPMTFLDYHHQDEVRQLLVELAVDHPITVIAVTHDVNHAVLESDRVIALREGRVVFRGTPQELMHPDRLQQIYASPFVLTTHPQTAMPMVVPRWLREEEA